MKYSVRLTDEVDEDSVDYEAPTMMDAAKKHVEAVCDDLADGQVIDVLVNGDRFKVRVSIRTTLDAFRAKAVKL